MLSLGLNSLGGLLVCRGDGASQQHVRAARLSSRVACNVPAVVPWRRGAEAHPGSSGTLSIGVRVVEAKSGGKKEKKKMRNLVKRASDAVEMSMLELHTNELRWNNERMRLLAEKEEAAQEAARWKALSKDRHDAMLNQMELLAEEVGALRGELRAALASGGSVAAAAPLTAAEKSSPPPPDAFEAQALKMLNLDGGAADAAPEPAPAASSALDLPVEDEMPVVLNTGEWEGDGTDRGEEWPLVKSGDDDIYLMTTLHASLNDNGFWAGEEDEEDMFFGPSTQDALCYFQASKGMLETGVCDNDTWKELLGERNFKAGPVPGAIGFEEDPYSPEAIAAAAAAANVKTTATTAATATMTKSGLNGGKDCMDGPVQTMMLGDEDYKSEYGEEDQGEAEGDRFVKAAKGHTWKVLRYEEGGFAVHKMQVLLEEKGFNSGEDDMQYWYFGSLTEEALRTFQDSAKIPATGITDLATWKALLGEERYEVGPASLKDVGDGDYGNDVSNTDRVFLIGEQRFEKSKTKAKKVQKAKKA